MSEQHTTEPLALFHAKWLENSLTIGAAEAGAELRRLHTIEKQRDELLAALEEAAFRAAHGECAHVQLVCDTAIASVKGGA